ncbi:MAG TPA: 23S rRNA (pseudouridine(1915)-N(3))-methyltransferase RlmH [Gammaproteobacteria bacterium]|nr:23S rRNA (pseudouridine(1915)-N(3))-methyltransferase RlmH [Candidatus Parabeggiatoa sp.]HAI69077.1 23S rRNA (pseudouridine(1915)-N(3))-methyltransferase RlmH [Gammaproteobacteria bacterium]
MHIDLICIGQKMPSWVQSGFSDYAKRLPSTCSVHLIEIPLRKRTKNADLARLQHKEGEQMLAAIAQGALVVALDEGGQAFSSIQLADQLAHWMQITSKVALLVGGPEGLSAACRKRAQQCWSLSTLTLPHQLVRIVVVEQLYRAWSLLNNHPYHRG